LSFDLLSQDEEALGQNHIVRTVYDPCCGSAGMLIIAKERILEINPKAEVYLSGPESLVSYASER
jgi:type I restriction enzyme M protein